MLGVVLEIEEVDDGHVDLLAVAVATPDALFDTLRVPGQVEIHEERAELKIDTFGPGFRGDQDRLLVAEGFDDGGLHVGRLGAGDSIGAFVLDQPVLKDGLALRIGILAVQKNDFIGIAAVGKQLRQVVLGADGFGEDDNFALSALFDDLVENAGKRVDEFVAFFVLADGKGELAVFLQQGDFSAKFARVDDGRRLFGVALGRRVRVVEFLGILLDRVVVGNGFKRRRLHLLEALDDLGERCGNGEGR